MKNLFHFEYPSPLVLFKYISSFDIFFNYSLCQYFIETWTWNLAKTNTNKAYQERDDRFNMEEWKNIFTLLQWDDQWMNDWYKDDQYDTINEWNTLIYRV